MVQWLPLPRDYARAFAAHTEAEAVLVRQILEEAGIPVIIRSRQVPGYGEVIQDATGVWGDVLVPVLYESAARRYVDEHLRQMKEAAVVSRFAGIIPPMVTLFAEDGRIDEEANRAHVEFLIAGGVHGVFALGSTGEAMHLTVEERRSFASLVVRAVDGRVPVLIGCLSTSTDEAVALARHAAEAGADGVIVIPPYYWTPNDAAIETHIAAVAQAVGPSTQLGTGLPVLIYNFPAVVGRSIPAALVAKLARDHANVLGIKETIDSISHIHEVIARVKPGKPEFSVLCGYEFHLLNTLLSGGDGCIPAVANVAPEPSVAIYEHWRAGRIAEAAAVMRQRLALGQLYQLDAPLFVVVKEAMVLLERIPRATVRAPARPLTADGRTGLRTLLSAAGLL